MLKESLAFVRKMSIGDEGLLRNAIEKYELARKMIKGGMTPAQVKTSLEYATEFTYKGKAYEWKNPAINITGSIPYTH